jgi:hypothetical protein
VKNKITYEIEDEVLQKGLEVFSEFLEKHFSNVELIKWVEKPYLTDGTVFLELLISKKIKHYGLRLFQNMKIRLCAFLKI